MIARTDEHFAQTPLHPDDHGEIGETGEIEGEPADLRADAQPARLSGDRYGDVLVTLLSAMARGGLK
jgi:hypothetical protein